ncbi:MAG: DUF6293 family protein [Halobacteriales archaeon]|nr:DUF6293 family protein [Halobacteriales archaeon]
MNESVHFIPVGFDFERLIFPISKGELEADRVVLITHEDKPSDFDSEDKSAARLAENLTRRLDTSFEMIDKNTDKLRITQNELYDYEEIYQIAYEQLLKELQEGNEVSVNISSMPRTVAFGFATAADTLITEKKDDIEDIRGRLRTYYVRPQKYVTLEMLEELKREVRYLGELDDSQAEERQEQLQSLINKVEDGGVTEGTKNPPGSDKMYVEFPASPGSDIEGFEEDILYFLSEKGPFPSISDLAKTFAEYEGVQYGDSYRSRVQYNVSNLEEKGYVTQQEAGNRVETRISTMGRMWVKTHPKTLPDV